jgi:hypothetical protein
VGLQVQALRHSLQLPEERSVMTTKNMIAKSLSKVKPDHESKVTEAFRRAMNG